MSVTPLLETPNTTLLPLAHLLRDTTCRQLTYVHTHTFCLCSVCIVSDCVCTQGIPIGRHEPPTAMPDAADPFIRSVPDSDPSRTSAMEDLKRLVHRYLHNPDSRVDTLRVGLSPSGSRRYMVMIMLEVDDII